MGIFTRFKDIIGSNINSMLESAEDPEKLARLMIKEMEDTLIEMKSGCAKTMAEAKRSERAREQVEAKTQEWASKAELAMRKGRDDLAREALIKKRAYAEKVEALQSEANELKDLVEQYRGDIGQVEEKLATAREKHRVLVQRHSHAAKKKVAQTRIRKVDNNDVLMRFEDFENRIDRMEADADLVNGTRKQPASLNDEFDRLVVDDDIEQELQELKNRSGSNAGETSQPSNA
jgi:phage shock protein A